jgi:murein DD-endopeptidase MepM/ murein hydrolase activator NlpD
VDIQATLVPTDALPLAGNGAVLKVPQALTIIPKRPRKEVITYTVAAGDNLSDVSERFDIDVDSLIWANDKLEEDPDYLLIGQVLRIPPVSGVLYSAQTGDTIDSIAKKFKGDVRTMMELEFNSISSASSTPISGTLVMIPGGEKAYQPRLVYINGLAVMVNAPRGGGRFMWPTQGYITTFFGENGHAGIDIAGPLGTPIYAADAGVIVFAGWNGGYGNCIIIDHGNDYQTVYGHLTTYYPQVGQNVRRGQAIGKMGSTGNSTGSHLHFEVQYGGGLVNPLRYLPQ